MLDLYTAISLFFSPLQKEICLLTRALFNQNVIWIGGFSGYCLFVSFSQKCKKGLNLFGKC
jgi:hypothetical protein